MHSMHQWWSMKFFFRNLQFPAQNKGWTGMFWNWPLAFHNWQLPKSIRRFAYRPNTGGGLARQGGGHRPTCLGLISTSFEVKRDTAEIQRFRISLPEIRHQRFGWLTWLALHSLPVTGGVSGRLAVTTLSSTSLLYRRNQWTGLRRGACPGDIWNWRLGPSTTSLEVKRGDVRLSSLHVARPTSSLNSPLDSVAKWAQLIFGNSCSRKIANFLRAWDGWGQQRVASETLANCVRRVAEWDSSTHFSWMPTFCEIGSGNKIVKQSKA